MFFNSWQFLILLIATLLFYYIPVRQRYSRPWQVFLLLLASALFYSWGNPKLILLLGFSCIFNSLAVERIVFWKLSHPVNSSNQGEGNRSGYEESDNQLEHQPARVFQSKARNWLVFAVSANLFLLAFYKYADFLLTFIPHGFASNWITDWARNIPLPVGISFYTFQGISLVVDTWRRDISPESIKLLSKGGSARISSARDISFYIMFFPQLVAGPIVKARDFLDQIGAKKFRDICWVTARRSLITGYFLKIFVADNLAEQTAILSNGADNIATMGCINSIALLYSYSLQIFADFAGYSLIAIGLGALFGYRLPQNFNFPYLSTSITEFWRRWHLSLSSWLKDYLYIPLGGSRKGGGRTCLNLFLVMFLGGLWHGAAWKFAIWGSLHGAFLVFERLISSVNRSTTRSEYPEQKVANSKRQSSTTPIVLLKWLLTFHLVTALWLTFMMPDLASIRAFFNAATSMDFKIFGPPIFALIYYGSFIVAYHGWGWLQEHRPALVHRLCRSPLEAVLHGLMIFLIATNPGAPGGFIYFQF
jgi:alginate O-acetyltransferase complex protein AlgI